MSTEDELNAGRERLKQHEKSAELAREASRRADLKSGTSGIDADPVILKPYLASAAVDGAGSIQVGKVIMDETDDERNAREALILAEENARMQRRLGGTPDPMFNPDADAERQAEQKRVDADAAAKEESNKAAEADVRSRILATTATDSKAIGDDVTAAAKEAKKDEASEKTTGSTGNSVLDDLLSDDPKPTKKK